jgi:stage III sporulation protein AB
MKVAGMFFIIISCTAGGYAISSKISLRMRQINGFLDFFEYIIKSITVYKYPIEKIFILYSNSILEECGFLGKLAKNGRVNGVYINPWKTSLNECKEDQTLNLKDDAFKIIALFGERLGVGQLDEQLRHMTVCRDKLQNLYKEQNEKAVKDMKLYRLSGGLIGLFICILLI